MKDCAERLRTVAWTTAGARYNAARRLQRRSRFSLITISLLSGVGVVTPLILGSDSAVSNFSVVLAMLVLIVGVFEGASEFGVRSAALFANAEDLNGFQSHIGVQICSGAALDVLELDSQYQHIKRSIQINHEPIDLKRFEVQHSASPEFASRSKSSIRDSWTVFCYGFQPIWWLLLLWIVAFAGLVITVFATR